jgi:hypothetical protein
MTAIRRVLGVAVVIGTAVFVPATLAGAIQNPTTGQPGTTAGFNCATSTAPVEPGNGHAATSPGSAFNESGSGISGMHFAGNGAASIANAGSTAAVSQYDTACRRLSN